MGLDAFWRPIDVIGCHILGRRFIGAQSVDDVLAAGEQLKKQGFKVTYNLLGEHITDRKMVETAVETTRQLFAKMNPDNDGNVSCKPTLYGLCLSKEVFAGIMEILAGYAYNRGVEIEFDAENYEYIPSTFEIFSRLASHPIFKNSVRQAVQAHLKNIEKLMDEYRLWDKNLRIVKGSGVYKEDGSLISQNEFLVVERYLEILRRNLRNGKMPFVATVRDARLAQEAMDLADSMKGPAVVQTLFGPLGAGFRNAMMRRGYPVSIYIPFTDTWCRDAWKPYGLRRARMMRRLLWEQAKKTYNLNDPCGPFLEIEKSTLAFFLNSCMISINSLI